MTRHFLLPDARLAYSRVGVVLYFLAALATLVRLTIRDLYFPISVLFYATPLPVLAAAWAAASLLAWKGGLRGLSRLGGGLCVSTCVWCYAAQFTHGPALDASRNAQSHAEAAGGPSLRILFWNMSGGSRGLAAAARVIEGFDAHLVGLVEARDRNEWVDQWWHSTLPQYRVIYGGNKIVLLVRDRPTHDPAGAPWKGQTAHVEFGELAHSGNYLSAVVEFENRRVRIVIADVMHSLVLSRAGPLRALTDLSARFASEPLILCGDMNTPVDSVHFGQLRIICRNAFEQTGEGWPYTWPTPFPVLSLDQIWYAGELTPRRAEIGWTVASDHQPIYAEFSLNRRLTVNEGAD